MADRPNYGRQATIKRAMPSHDIRGDFNIKQNKLSSNKELITYSHSSAGELLTKKIIHAYYKAK